MATAKQTKAAGAVDKGLKVTSRPDTFRRGGFSFTAEARVIALSDMTPEQYEQIVAEPMLVSQVVDMPPAEAETEQK